VTDSQQLDALSAAVSAFTEAGIGHALIGGLAVGVRTGVPRATLDVDLAVVTSVSRQDVASVLTATGFELTAEHAHTMNFVHPSGEPLQVSFDEGFDSYVERAQSVHVGDVDVPVVLKDDLVAMKQRAANDPARRPSKALRDRADVELLLGDVPDQSEGW
jgi:predicted nucleotidyltransferase